jgi:hypothetical protein
MPADNQSVADLLGAWVETDWESGLIERCKRAWSKPLRELTNQELATFLRQRIATAHILRVAEGRIADGVDDDTEMYEGELQAAIEYARKGI